MTAVSDSYSNYTKARLSMEQLENYATHLTRNNVTNMNPNVDFRKKRQLNIDCEIISSKAELPVYSTDGAGCFDIRTIESGVVKAKEQKIFSTGLKFAIPEGYVMLVFSRSGQGFKNGVRLANTTGIIDSDYRGELKVCLRNDSSIDYKIEAKDRICQAMVIPFLRCAFTQVDKLSETKRGESGFGSTGK